MKIFNLPFISVLMILIVPCQSQDYTCSEPPYYTFTESLYGSSPSNQMEIAHILIGVFNELGDRTSGRLVSDGIVFDDSADQRVGIRQEYINGVKTVIVTPGTVRNDKKIIYFHGGGYADELILFQWDMAVDIAKKSGSPVYLVDYRLAPDHLFPAPIDDGWAVYTKLLESFNPDEIVFMGDSAGGGLALALTGKLRDQDMPMPAQLVLISPWLDVAGDNPDMPDYDDLDMMLSVDGIQHGGTSYVGENNLHELDNPYASPLLLEDLQDLPPSILFIGTHEILYPDALLFREKAEQQGMDLTFVEVEGGFHVWLGAPAWLVPESAWARRQVASFVNCYQDGGRDGFQSNNDPSVLDFGKDIAIELYPNPLSTNSILRISGINVGDNEVSSCHIEVVDAGGRSVYQNMMSIQGTSTELDMADKLNKLSPGIYRLVITGSGYTSQVPLVINQ